METGNGKSDGVENACDKQTRLSRASLQFKGNPSIFEHDKTLETFIRGWNCQVSLGKTSYLGGGW